MMRGGPSCPYCAQPLAAWPALSLIEPCPVCRRPLLVARLPFDPSGTLPVRSILDLGSALYGLAMLLLVATFMLSGMTPRALVKALAILLFVIGSVLSVDGVLSVVTGIDRTRRRRCFGRVARLIGGGKLAAGLIALTLTVIGVGL